MEDYDDEFEENFDEYDEMASEQVIGYLIQVGAAVWDGMDDEGERIFKFNMPLLKEILPELYEDIMEDVDKVMLDLFQKGLAEVDYDENLNAHFKLSEEGHEELARRGFDYFHDENNDQ